MGSKTVLSIGLLKAYLNDMFCVEFRDIEITLKGQFYLISILENKYYLQYTGTKYMLIDSHGKRIGKQSKVEWILLDLSIAIIKNLHRSCKCFG